MSDPRDPYLAQFEKTARGLPGPVEARRAAIERFRFPDGSEEAWRFTDTTPIAETAFRPAAGTANPNQFAALARGALRACQIVFVDGRPAPEFSTPDLPPGVTATRLTEAAPVLDTPFAALNTALWSDGVQVRVARGVAAPQPIHLLFLSSFHGDPYVTHPRIRIVAEEDAQATIVESWLGPAGGTYFTNAVTEIDAAARARIDYVKVQRESREAFHVAALQARQGPGAILNHHSISLGARIARNDLGTVLDGEGAECALNGLFEVGGAQLADHHTTIDHAKPQGTSRELYKGVLDGRGRGVFDGRIVVRPDAQKTNAVQASKNLLLSADAIVHTKPQLEILANDVKCKHGATIGQLDEAILFYMRSRGLGLAEARRLLIHAFASEIIDQVKADAVRAQIGGCLGLFAA